MLQILRLRHIRTALEQLNVTDQKVPFQSSISSSLHGNGSQKKGLPFGKPFYFHKN